MWCQARLYKDHLRVACYKDRDDPGGQRHFREWSRTVDRNTEFLWSLLLQHLRKKAKATPPENKVLVLGDHSVPERHLRVLQKGPKFATEPFISPPERLTCVRNIARQVQQDLRPRFVSEAMDVVSTTASGSQV
ncbi:hypothetical protein HPB52_008571 [Rhipicephalus sanguineus]|uniref:Uncharacterized protein n=1 Tax=Rhipicephalus sanguineus TaxID=34632 RepID=A0A9D4QJ61_RHISA|nr:hypothetical protein HPB52_008571 [Rhipicephalus sanguineus]